MAHQGHQGSGPFRELPRCTHRPSTPVSLPSMFATPLILFTLGVYEMRMPEGHKDAILNGFDASSNNTRAKRKARQLTSKQLGHCTCPSPASQSSCDRPCRIRLLLFSFGFALNSPRLPSMPFASALHPLLNKPCHVHVDPLSRLLPWIQSTFRSQQWPPSAILISTLRPEIATMDVWTNKSNLSISMKMTRRILRTGRTEGRYRLY